MTTYILHGGYMRDKNQLNDAFYQRVTELVPDRGTILFVYFAADDESQYQELYLGQKAQMEEFASAKNLTYVCASSKCFLDEVREADAILIRGGSTNKLLAALHRYPKLAPLFNGKIIAGSSAGAYAIATLNYDKSEKAVRSGLGMLPVKVLCHYQSTDPGNFTGDDAIQIMNSALPELPLVVLKDHEWKEFTV